MTSTSVVQSSTDAQAKSKEKTTDSNEAATPASDTVADGKQTGESGDKCETTASPAKKPTVRKTDWEQGKVYLYQFDRCSKLPSLVSQCLRLETFLRVAGIQYENIDNIIRYRSATGSLPFIELNGKEMSDVENIIEELSKEFKDLDSDLTEAQKVTSYSLSSMILNHTSWVIRCWRYKHPQEFLKISGVDIKKTINSWVPSPLLNFMFKMGFRSNIKELIGHGIGNRNPEQIYNAGKKDLQTLNQALGGTKYFFGDKPHSLDCLVFAVLCQFIYVPFEGFDEYIKTETPNLLTFVEKMKEEYWKDWEELCSVAEANSKNVKKEGETDEAKKDDETTAEEKKKAEDAKKEKEEKKRKEKEEKERKKKEEKEEKERKKREAKEKAAKEKEKVTKDEKPVESGDAEAAKKESGDKGDKSDAEKPENKDNDTKAGDA